MRQAERDDVGAHAAHADDHRAFADAHELVHRGLPPKNDVVADRDMAAEHRVVGEDHVVADVAVVRRHASRP